MLSRLVPLLRSLSERSNLYTRRKLYQGVSNHSAYTNEERGVILQKLNDINENKTREIIGEKFSKNIQQYIEKYGSIKSLEDLLLVKGVGPKSLRTLCTKLLHPENDESTSKKKKIIKLDQLAPDLPPSVLPDIKSIIAVHTDLKALSWTKVDCNKKYLTDWSITEFPDLRKRLPSLRTLLIMAEELVQEIPESDLYLFQDPGMQSSAFMNKFGFHHLNIVLSTFLYIKRESPGQPKIAFVEPKIVERAFGAVVGGETVSVQSHVDDMINQKLNLGHTSLYIEPMLSKYFKQQPPYLKENLSISCLIAVAALDKFIRPYKFVPRKNTEERD